MKEPKEPYKLPKRFRVSRGTLWFDHFMNYFIVVGGISVIAAVMGIFVFIFFQILPLFQGARVTELSKHKLTESLDEIKAVDMDEWAELPMMIHADGSLEYLDLSGKRDFAEPKATFNAGEVVEVLNYNPLNRILAAASQSGKFAYAHLGYRAEFDENTKRTIHPELTVSDWFPLAKEGEQITAIDYGEGDTNKMAAALCVDNSGNQHLRAVTLQQKRSLFGGGGNISIGQSFDLTSQIDERVQSLDVSSNGNLVLAIAESGQIFLFIHEENQLSLRQRFWPFDNLEEKQIGKTGFLLGDGSVVFTSKSGHNRIFSLSLDYNEGKR
ncbi:MAG: hypothetical protein KJT03_16175, partial [Verrucomicrobiae bacterium]|nr:hypothetical protein [Verrucomicrobiae bacterium]